MLAAGHRGCADQVIQARGDLNLVRCGRQSLTPSRMDILTLTQHCEIPTSLLVRIVLANKSQDIWWVVTHISKQVSGP